MLEEECASFSTAEVCLSCVQMDQAVLEFNRGFWTSKQFFLVPLSLENFLSCKEKQHPEANQWLLHLTVFTFLWICCFICSFVTYLLFIHVYSYMSVFVFSYEPDILLVSDSVQNFLPCYFIFYLFLVVVLLCLFFDLDVIAQIYEQWFLRCSLDIYGFVYSIMQGLHKSIPSCESYCNWGNSTGKFFTVEYLLKFLPCTNRLFYPACFRSWWQEKRTWE